MDGQQQTQYPRKNWSSAVLFNAGHPNNRHLTRDCVNDESKTGAWFHRFSWLPDEEVGEFSHEWNWLVGWYKEPEDGSPKALHYTEGGPWFEEYQDCEYANEYYKAERLYLTKELEDQKKKVRLEKEKVRYIDSTTFSQPIKEYLNKSLYEKN